MEKVSYYMSSMILFNVFYMIKKFSMIDDYSKLFVENKVENVFSLICAIISLVFIFWGVIYTIILLIYNFNPLPYENGKKYKLLNVSNITSTEFLGKFSLLVMTGLTIGSVPLWWGIIIYLVFYVVIGIMFVRCDIFYINPVVMLWGYRVYKCKCETTDKNEIIYFVVKNKELKENDTVKATFTKKRIIRLKGEKK